MFEIIGAAPGTGSAWQGRVPSVLHEVLVALFRDEPRLLLGLLEGRLDLLGGRPLRFERDEPNFSQLTEIDADLVLVVYGPMGELLCALIVEIQLEKDRRKERSWPAYQAGLHRRLGCPCFVVVVTIDARVAEWAAGPFCTGQTLFRPWVIAPAQVPRVTDFEPGRDTIELVLLSGLAHRYEPEAEQIGELLWRLLERSEVEHASLYWDLFLSKVGEATRRSLEMRFADYMPQSDWGKRHYAKGQLKGQLEGRANALVVLLEARRLPLAAEHRARIDACADLDQLDTWLRLAATATNIREVFDD